MKIRLRYRHPIARLLRVEGMVLYPYILFSRHPDEVSAEVLQHEWIHVRQVRRIGILRFYGMYLSEYLRNRLTGLSHEKAYRAISFEREAYSLAASTHLTEIERLEMNRRV